MKRSNTSHDNFSGTTPVTQRDHLNVKSDHEAVTQVIGGIHASEQANLRTVRDGGQEIRDCSRFESSGSQSAFPLTFSPELLTLSYHAGASTNNSGIVNKQSLENITPSHFLSHSQQWQRQQVPKFTIAGEIGTSKECMQQV